MVAAHRAQSRAPLPRRRAGHAGRGRAAGARRGSTTPIRTSSAAGSGSASSSRRPWPAVRRCSSPTSRRPRSTPPPRPSCWRCSRSLQARLGLAVLMASHDLGALAALAAPGDRDVRGHGWWRAGRRPRSSATRCIPTRAGCSRAYPRPATAGRPPCRSGRRFPASPPDPAHCGAGCAFEPRCADRRPVCRERPRAETRPPRAATSAASCMEDSEPLVRIRGLTRTYVRRRGPRATRRVEALAGVDLDDRARARSSRWSGNPARASRRWRAASPGSRSRPAARSGSRARTCSSLPPRPPARAPRARAAPLPGLGGRARSRGSPRRRSSPSRSTSSAAAAAASGSARALELMESVGLSARLGGPPAPRSQRRPAPAAGHRARARGGAAPADPGRGLRRPRRLRSRPRSRACSSPCAREKGLTYLCISHDLALMSVLADEVAILFEGRIVERGRRRELFTAPAHPHTRALVAAVPSAARPLAAAAGDRRHEAARPPRAPRPPRPLRRLRPLLRDGRARPRRLLRGDAPRPAHLGGDAAGPARASRPRSAAARSATLLWLASLARGELGYSFAYGSPVGPLLWPRMRNTLLLTVTAVAAAWLLAVPLGVWWATRAAAGGAPRPGRR